MKKLCFCIILAIASISFANTHITEEKYKILTVEDFVRSNIFEQIKNLSKKEKEKQLFSSIDPQTVLAFEKGKKYPIKLILKGDFFSLNNEETPVVSINKDFYIRVEDEKFLFSTDLKKWEEAPIFFTGEVGLGLGMLKETAMPMLKLKAKFKKR